MERNIAPAFSKKPPGPPPLVTLLLCSPSGAVASSVFCVSSVLLSWPKLKMAVTGAGPGCLWGRVGADADARRLRAKPASCERSRRGEGRGGERRDREIQAEVHARDAVGGVVIARRGRGGYPTNVNS